MPWLLRSRLKKSKRKKNADPRTMMISKHKAPNYEPIFSDLKDLKIPKQQCSTTEDWDAILKPINDDEDWLFRDYGSLKTNSIFSDQAICPEPDSINDDDDWLFRDHSSSKTNSI